jgi:hypothetical protein
LAFLTADRSSRRIEPDGGGGGRPVARQRTARENLDEDHLPATTRTGRQGCLWLVLAGIGACFCRQHRAKQRAQPRDIGGAACIGKQPVMANAVKAARPLLTNEKLKSRWKTKDNFRIIWIL